MFELENREDLGGLSIYSSEDLSSSWWLGWCRQIGSLQQYSKVVSQDRSFHSA